MTWFSLERTGKKTIVDSESEQYPCFGVNYNPVFDVSSSSVANHGSTSFEERLGERKWEVGGSEGASV